MVLIKPPWLSKCCQSKSVKAVQTKRLFQICVFPVNQQHETDDLLVGFPGPLTVIVHPQAKVWRSGHLAALTRRRKGLVLHRLQASKLLFLATGWSTGFFKSGTDECMTWAISSACVFFCRGRFDKMMIMEEWKVCNVQVSMAADIQWLQTVFWLWSDFGWMKNSELQLLSYFWTFFTLATSGDPSS